MSVREKDNPALYTRIRDQNLLRQYDLLSNCVEIGLEKGIEAFDKYTLWADRKHDERRIISAWRAEPHERRYYWQNIEGHAIES
jgi:hypothetical protein